MEIFRKDLLSAAAGELQRKLDKLEAKKWAPFRNFRHRRLARKYEIICKRMKA